VRWPAFILVFGLLSSPVAGAPAPSSGLQAVHRTARVSYYAAGKRKVDVRRTEAFLESLSDLFGLSGEALRIEYRLHDTDVVRLETNGYAAVGVTDLDAQRIDTVLAYHPHELAHAVAGRLGRPPLLFAEGLAVALTSGGSWQGRDIDLAARSALAGGMRVEALLDSFYDADPDHAYAIAGSFVSDLLDRHGIEPLVAFLRGCRPGGGSYEKAFRRAYGHSVARAAVEWRRALDGTRAARPWHDPSTWPGSLSREPVTRTAEVLPAPPAEPATSGSSTLLMPAGLEALGEASER
jgi:hypothetical protein